jgi:hypothetical protein
MLANASENRNTKRSTRRNEEREKKQCSAFLARGRGGGKEPKTVGKTNALVPVGW